VSNPVVLSNELNPSGIRGADALAELVNAALTIEDDRGVLQPRLAEAVPAIDNGLWIVFPDGRMETTWKIRPGAQWHDGTPLTSDDFIFSSQVRRDRDLPELRAKEWGSVESVEAPDPTTVVVTWREPAITADALFSVPALPRHLLERPYTEDKGRFRDLAYWSTEFIGTGPFRLKEWVATSHLILEANERYALGKPKIETVEVKIIPDANTLVANILADSVVLTLGLTLSLDQANQLRDQWRRGTVDVKVQDWVVAFPQFVNPNPSVIGDLRFRRALLQAVDRQELAQSIQFGLVPVAHAIVYPGTPEYAAVEPGIVKYAYDEGSASRAIEALGYTRGADGIFRDPRGERLSVQIQSSAVLDINMKTLHPVANYWQRTGVAVENDIVPPQRAADREYRAAFPGFSLQRQPAGLRALDRYFGSEARLPERNFTGNNNARYVNAEFDAALQRYFTTIPIRPRYEALGEVVHRMSDQLTVLPFFYDTKSTMIGERLVNVTGVGFSSTQAWNAHEWDLR
jgi:peptide/nickel transport system substrate-binding protein